MNEISAILFFIGVLFGMLLGAMLHAGLDERGVAEYSWSPGWRACRQYKKDIKMQPIGKLAADGNELKEFLEKNRHRGYRHGGKRI